MERITVFGDIHGNMPALEATFANMQQRGLDDNWYCLGDLVGYGVFPNEVVSAIRQREIPTIMGNYDSFGTLTPIYRWQNKSALRSQSLPSALGDSYAGV